MPPTRRGRVVVDDDEIDEDLRNEHQQALRNQQAFGAAAQASVLYGGDSPVAFEFPRNLVCYTVPGVICGGQIGPRLQGSIAQRDAERALGLVFVCVGAAFLKAGLSHQ